MKVFRIAGMMILAVISCLSFTACSEDEDGNNVSSPYATEILGMWECIESGYRMDLGDRIKFFSGEFDEAQWNKGGTLKGKKCIHLYYQVMLTKFLLPPADCLYKKGSYHK